MEKMIKKLIAMNLLFDNLKEMLVKMQVTNELLDRLEAEVYASPHQKHFKQKNCKRKR